MAQALICGCICVAAYSIFLMIRGMVRLYKLKEMKLFWSALIFFIGDPLLLLGVFLLIRQYNIWTVLPALVLAVAWVFMGYALEIFLRKERERKANGMKRIIPRAKPGQLRKDLLLLAVALVLWALGASGIFGAHGVLETCAVCVCFFLLASSVSDLWKYRGF